MRNAERLEQALRSADFEPDSQHIWRWRADEPDARMVVRFELLADLGDEPAGAEIQFDGCGSLGAANLRGTGFASGTAIGNARRAEPVPCGGARR